MHQPTQNTSISDTSTCSSDKLLYHFLLTLIRTLRLNHRTPHLITMINTFTAVDLTANNCTAIEQSMRHEYQPLCRYMYKSQHTTHVCSTTAHHWLDCSLFADCPQLKIQDSPVWLLGTGLVQHHQTKALCLTIWTSYLYDVKVHVYMCVHVYNYVYACAIKLIQVTTSEYSQDH